VKPPLAEARGFHAQPLGHSPAVLRRSLRLSTLAKRPALHHPQPRGDWQVFFRATALTPRVARGRAKPVPFAGSNPFDATRWNACAPLQALAVWIASRRLSKTKRQERRNRDSARRASRTGDTAETAASCTCLAERASFALGGPASPRDIFRAAPVCSRFAHQIETAQSFAKYGVTDIAASIQDDGACAFISRIRLQWQFKDEACGALARHSSRDCEGVRTLKACAGNRPSAMRSKP
jgi:hypothetical protein